MSEGKGNGLPEPSARAATVSALHLLLSKLHEALALNRYPDPEVADLAHRLAEWWRGHDAACNRHPEGHQPARQS